MGDGEALETGQSYVLREKKEEEEKMTKRRKARRIVLKIVFGAAGGILFGLAARDILFEYVLPPEFQTPVVMLILGFAFLFVARSV